MAELLLGKPRVVTDESVGVVQVQSREYPLQLHCVPIRHTIGVWLPKRNASLCA